ncbi:lytic transglycosylase domain-containing protein [Massilia sp. YMA4]|uniref:Lytic transglycosylase domain-containing protein n=1 Tax=[Empedobacter] haloabium TaxID=592317 RepID=A0ABZ1URR1_9BURK|nr:lytic transglycosylase domain-containing protein [Massilia sp. YMA4]AXA91334.1 lytic transglycosylase [Massilia sp. YMA4]
MRILLALLLAPVALHAHASAPCWHLAAIEGGVTVELLQAIAWTESSMNPSAVNDTHRHKTGTRDIGLVGINTAPRVLRNLGVSESDLFDACINLRAGARILREKIARHGMTWEAVGAYCVSCTRLKGDECRAARAAYAWRVYRAMGKHANAGGPRHIASTARARANTIESPASIMSLR